MRAFMRRFNRPALGFSKKFESYCHMAALYATQYNFINQHKSPKGITPAMAAGVFQTLWMMEDVVALIDARAAKPNRPAIFRNAARQRESQEKQRSFTMRTIVFAALIAASWSSSALAQTKGIDWKENCDARDQTPKQGLCLGYLSGSLDGIRLMQKTTGTIILCEPPQGISVPQWLAIIRRYLDSHPEELHLAAASLIPAMVNQAFPCR